MGKVDNRKIAVDRAVQALKEAGAETCSVLATWPDGDHRTALLVPHRHKNVQALGKGLQAVQNETPKVGTLLGKG